MKKIMILICLLGLTSVTYTADLPPPNEQSVAMSTESCPPDHQACFEDIESKVLECLNGAGMNLPDQYPISYFQIAPGGTKIPCAEYTVGVIQLTPGYLTPDCIEEIWDQIKRVTDTLHSQNRLAPFLINSIYELIKIENITIPGPRYIEGVFLVNALQIRRLQAVKDKAKVLKLSLETIGRKYSLPFLAN